MRISILQGAFLPIPPLRGGAVEKMWFVLGAEFARLGHAVTHVSRKYLGLPENESIAGVRHVRVRGYDRPSRRLGQQLDDLRYTWRALRHTPEGDVIITNTFWAPFIARRRHGKIYVDVQRMPRGQTRFYHRAARLRANSCAVAEAIAVEAPRMADRVRVVPNPLPFVSATAVNWSAKTKTVLYAGRLHPEKGLEMLLRAWRLLRARQALLDWTLVIVGPSQIEMGGGGAAWFQRLVNEVPVDGVRWVGEINEQPVLNRYYEQAAVFAYPSVAERGETFGLAVLEAMAWGATPVVSDLACFRDFVTDRRNGCVFDHRSKAAVSLLAAAIQAAAEPEARRLAEAATAVRMTHGISRIAAEFLADFESIL